MHSIKQKISYPQEGFEVATNSNAASPPLPHAISVTQIKNAQEQPSTSKTRCFRKKADKFVLKAPKNHQQQVLELLLNMLSGKKALQFYKDKTTPIEQKKKKMTTSEQATLLCYCEHMSAARYALASFIKLRSNIVELMVECTDDVSKKIATRDSTLAHLINNLASYLERSELLTTAKTSQPSRRRLRTKKNNTRLKMKRSQNRLNESNKLYQAAIAEMNKSGKTLIKIEEQIYRQYSRHWFFMVCAKVLKALSPQEVETAISNIMKKPRLTSSHSLDILQKQPFQQDIQESLDLAASFFTPKLDTSLIKFTVSRMSLDRLFWDSFDENLELEQFIDKFYFFMFTSWKNETVYEQELTRDLLAMARLGNLTKRQYRLLALRCFQKELKFNALTLIRYILSVKKYEEDFKALENYRLPSNSLNNYASNSTRQLEFFNPKDAFKTYTQRLTWSNTRSEEELAKFICGLSGEKIAKGKQISKMEEKIDLTIKNTCQYIDKQLKACRDKRALVREDIVSCVTPCTEEYNSLYTKYPKHTLEPPASSSTNNEQPSQKKTRLESSLKALQWSDEKATTMLNQNKLLLEEKLFELPNFGQEETARLPATKNNEDNLQGKDSLSEYLEPTIQDEQETQVLNINQYPMINFKPQQSKSQNFSLNEVDPLAELFPELTDLI